MRAAPSRGDEERPLGPKARAPPASIVEFRPRPGARPRPPLVPPPRNISRFRSGRSRCPRSSAMPWRPWSSRASRRPRASPQPDTWMSQASSLRLFYLLLALIMPQSSSSSLPTSSRRASLAFLLFSSCPLYRTMFLLLVPIARISSVVFCCPLPLHLSPSPFPCPPPSLLRLLLPFSLPLYLPLYILFFFRFFFSFFYFCVLFPLAVACRRWFLILRP